MMGLGASKSRRTMREPVTSTSSSFSVPGCCCWPKAGPPAPTPAAIAHRAAAIGLSSKRASDARLFRTADLLAAGITEGGETIDAPDYDFCILFSVLDGFIEQSMTTPNARLRARGTL